MRTPRPPCRPQKRTHPRREPERGRGAEPEQPRTALPHGPVPATPQRTPASSRGNVQVAENQSVARTAEDPSASFADDGATAVEQVFVLVFVLFVVGGSCADLESAAVAESSDLGPEPASAQLKPATLLDGCHQRTQGEGPVLVQVLR